MKTLEQIQLALDEIAEVCKKHGVVLYGICESEGIYGEIEIAEVAPDHRTWKTAPWKSGYSGEYQVEAIGINKEG